jgi:hypothetical protein
MENDADFRTDQAYSYGASISTLFLREDLNNSLLHIPFTAYQKQDNYISFSYAHQIYTPELIEEIELVTDDRPYAGYAYFQVGLYQSYNKTLKSLIVQLGLIGPSSGMEQVQDFVHEIIGSPIPEGWDNQLKDEFTFQINYDIKHFIETDDFLDLHSAVIPEYGFELGNVSTKLYAGTLIRWGWGIAKDYGVAPINNNSYSKIPINKTIESLNGWNFCFNFSARANLIAKNIFLDGNSFVKSHNVEKNYFTVDAGYGFSLSYNKFTLDYLRKHTSKEFKNQKNMNSCGSLLFSYNF